MNPYTFIEQFRYQVLLFCSRLVKIAISLAKIHLYDMYFGECVGNCVYLRL